MAKKLVDVSGIVHKYRESNFIEKEFSYAFIKHLLIIFLSITGTVAFGGGNPNRGKVLFAECAACHSIIRGAEGVGPSLVDVVGRKAGSVIDFRYSPALKNSKIVWTPDSIAKFIADPQKLIRGNRMPYSGMLNAQDRADLISYLIKIKAK